MINRNYAKLINEYPQFAPNPILHDNSWIGNPSNEIYEQEGYKMVIYTDKLIAPEGYYYEESWSETENTIVQGWELVEKPISEEEALTRYINELTDGSNETLEEATENLIKIIKENN